MGKKLMGKIPLLKLSSKSRNWPSEVVGGTPVDSSSLYINKIINIMNGGSFITQLN